MIALLTNCTNRILVNLVHRKISSHIYQSAREVKVMDSKNRQQLQDKIESELSNIMNNSDSNSIESNKAVNHKKVQNFAIAFTSNNSETRTCGVDDDGNWVCKP